MTLHKDVLILLFLHNTTGVQQWYRLCTTVILIHGTNSDLRENFLKWADANPDQYTILNDFTKPFIGTKCDKNAELVMSLYNSIMGSEPTSTSTLNILSGV
jgi:hypothetical protein